MTYLNNFMSNGKELFQNAFARYTAPSLGRIFRTIVTNVPKSNHQNLARDLANFNNPRAYGSATEPYNEMHFLRQNLLNNIGSYVKNCELPMNTFQGIIENLLSNCYEDHLGELYFEREIPNAFEGFLRFAMNQSLNQAQHEDPEKKFSQLKFSVEKMQVAAKRHEDDKEFARIYHLMNQDENLITRGKDSHVNNDFWNILKYIQSPNNAEDLAYAALRHVYPSKKQSENKILQYGDNFWDMNMPGIVSVLNNLRLALQCEIPKVVVK